MGTAEWGVMVAGGSLTLAVGGLILRAVFEHEAQPLRVGVLELKNAITTLNELLRGEIESRKEDQGDLHLILRKQGEILEQLEGIVANHETRITVIEKTTGLDGTSKSRRRA